MSELPWWIWLLGWITCGLLFAIGSFGHLVNVWRELRVDRQGRLVRWPARAICVITILICAVGGPLMYVADFFSRRR